MSFAINNLPPQVANTVSMSLYRHSAATPTGEGNGVVDAWSPTTPTDGDQSLTGQQNFLRAMRSGGTYGSANASEWCHTEGGAHDNSGNSQSSGGSGSNGISSQMQAQLDQMAQNARTMRMERSVVSQSNQKMNSQIQNSFSASQARAKADWDAFEKREAAFQGNSKTDAKA